MDNIIYTQTLKYFWLAIERFLPTLNEIEKNTSNKTDKQEAHDLIEVYLEIKKQIDVLGLNYENPNRVYPGERSEVHNFLREDMIENLSQLSLRLLESWKEEKEILETKKYSTEKDQRRVQDLEQLIWPLDALSKAENYVIGKNRIKGILIFPGENRIEPEEEKPIIEIYAQ